jgi:acyl carrier protein
MSIDEFITEFKDLTRSDALIKPDTMLEAIREYDSLSKLILMNYLNDRFGIKVSARELTALKTVNDIFNLIHHAA